MAQVDKSNLIKFQSGIDLTGDEGSVSNQSKEDLANEDESVSIRRDIEFCELYFRVIDKQLARGDYDENIKQAVSHFSKIRSQTDKWCRFKEGNDLEQINLLKQSFYYRMLCIYSNATCISSAVAYYFENFLNQNLKSLKGLLNKKVLKICSIGGGLPSDVVAFIKVLESSIFIQDDMQIHITVIDVERKWKRPCIAILHSMENFNKKRWKIDFIILDLSSQSLSRKVTSAIKEAHFVSLFKFVTLLENQDSEFKRNLFLKLSNLVSPGSVLFLLDDSTLEVITVFQGYLGRLHGYNLLFEVVCHLHTLHLPVVKRHYDLYSKHLMRTGMCNTSFQLFCRAWVRTDKIFLSTGSHLQSFSPEIKMAEKRLGEKIALHCQLRLLYHQLNNNEIPEGWRDCFVTEMKNQEFTERKIKKMLKAAEKDPHLGKIYAKQLMLASYQDFLEEARELFKDSQKESDEALKDEKRKDFYNMKIRTDVEQKTYESFIKNQFRFV